MSFQAIDYSFRICDEDRGLAVTVVTLSPRGPRPQPAFLTFATFNDAASGERLDVTERSGVWTLTLPTAGGEIRFTPQRREVRLEDPQFGPPRTVRSDDANALGELDAALREDPVFFPIQIRFLEALRESLPEIEVEHYVDFDLLDPILGPSELTAVELGRGRRRRRRGGEEKTFKVDWNIYPRFVDCMDKCTDDCAWYEVWCYTACFFKCLVFCALGIDALLLAGDGIFVQDSPTLLRDTPPVTLRDLPRLSPPAAV